MRKNMEEQMTNNIKAAEEKSGVGRQNIRYYEKMGLLHPQRNEENNYRVYTADDIRRLKRIRLLRRLDMPLEDIRKMFDGEMELADAMKLQKVRLRKEKERVTDILNFCEEITEKQLSDFDEEYYLEQMECKESQGTVFANFLSDFKKVSKAEKKACFSFMPDNSMCMNPQEFKEALYEYAEDNKLDLVITKGGMYPEFTIDGVEYTADRVLSRWGAVIHCHMKCAEETKPEGMTDRKYRILRVIVRGWIPILVAAVVTWMIIYSTGDLRYGLLFFVIFLVLFWSSWAGYFRNLK